MNLGFGLGSLYQQAITLGRKIEQLLAGFSKDRFGVSLILMSKCMKDPNFFLLGFDSLVYKQSKQQSVFHQKVLDTYGAHEQWVTLVVTRKDGQRIFRVAICVQCPWLSNLSQQL